MAASSPWRFHSQLNSLDTQEEQRSPCPSGAPSLGTRTVLGPKPQCSRRKAAELGGGSRRKRRYLCVQTGGIPFPGWAPGSSGYSSVPAQRPQPRRGSCSITPRGGAVTSWLHPAAWSRRASLKQQPRQRTFGDSPGRWAERRNRKHCDLVGPILKNHVIVYFSVVVNAL